MSEGTAPEHRHVTVEAVNQAISFLEIDGIHALALPAEKRSADVQQKLTTKTNHVRNFLDISGEDPQAAVVRNTFHNFEIAGAESLDDAKALLGKYDSFHPHELPEDALERKQDLMDRWIAVQVLKQRNADNAQLAPELTGKQYSLPEGFKLLKVETYPADVSFDNVKDAETALEQYRVLSSPLSNTNEEAPIRNYVISSEGVTSEPVPVSGFFYQEFPNDVSVSAQRNTRKIYGVSPIEGFAYLTGNPVVYSPMAQVDIESPMPDTKNAKVSVPFRQFSEVFAAVSGRAEMAMTEEPNKSWPGTVKLDYPGGNLKFTGGQSFDADGKLYNRQGSNRNASKAPTFSVELDLGRISPAATSEVIKRLSAWNTLQERK